MPSPVARAYFDAVGVSNVGLKCEDPSRTVQASKDECDLNVIIKKYLRTGELPEARKAAYMDLSEIPDLKGALDTVIAAEEAFMSLPASVRRYFDNDPVKLVEFSSDDKNYAKAAELGLVTPRKLPDPVPPGQGAPAPQPPAGGPNKPTT